MNKWEYNVGRLPEDQHSAAGSLKDQGLDGWELVAVILVRGFLYAFFKRPLVENGDSA